MQYNIFKDEEAREIWLYRKMLRIPWAYHIQQQHSAKQMYFFLNWWANRKIIRFVRNVSSCFEYFDYQFPTPGEELKTSITSSAIFTIQTRFILFYFIFTRKFTVNSYLNENPHQICLFNVWLAGFTQCDNHL